MVVISHQIRFRNPREMLVIDKIGDPLGLALITVINPQGKKASYFTEWSFGEHSPGIAATYIYFTSQRAIDFIKDIKKKKEEGTWYS